MAEAGDKRNQAQGLPLKHAAGVGPLTVNVAVPWTRPPQPLSYFSGGPRHWIPTCNGPGFSGTGPAVPSHGTAGILAWMAKCPADDQVTSTNSTRPGQPTHTMA